MIFSFFNLDFSLDKNSVHNSVSMDPIAIVPTIGRNGVFTLYLTMVLGLLSLSINLDAVWAADPEDAVLRNGRYISYEEQGLRFGAKILQVKQVEPSRYPKVRILPLHSLQEIELSPEQLNSIRESKTSQYYFQKLEKLEEMDAKSLLDKEEVQIQTNLDPHTVMRRLNDQAMQAPRKFVSFRPYIYDGDKGKEWEVVGLDTVAGETLGVIEHIGNREDGTRYVKIRDLKNRLYELTSKDPEFKTIRQSQRSLSEFANQEKGKGKLQNIQNDWVMVCQNGGGKGILAGLIQENYLQMAEELIPQVEFELGQRSILMQKQLKKELNYPMAGKGPGSGPIPSVGSFSVDKQISHIQHEGREYQIVTGKTKDVVSGPVISMGGSFVGRESIVLDPHSSPELQGHYALLKDRLLNIQAKVGYKRPPLRLVFGELRDYLGQRIFPKSPDLAKKLDQWVGHWTKEHHFDSEGFLSLPSGQRVPLIPIDDFIKAKIGVCRHHALVTSYFLNRLRDEGLLPPGQFHHTRDEVPNGAHSWTTYILDDGSEAWHIDTLWGVVKNFRDPMEYEELKAIGYGTKAIQNEAHRFLKPVLQMKVKRSTVGAYGPN